MAKLAKNELALKVNGKTFKGFESGQVTLTMEDPVNTFDLDYVADGRDPGKRAIFPGDQCELVINTGRGDETLIKGYVDTSDDEDGATGIRLRVAGRSKTADLVDCSAITKPGSWTNHPLSLIVMAIAKPYGVPVFLEADEGAPIAKFSTVAGETAWDAIQRVAAKRFLSCYSVAGHLVLAQTGPLSSLTQIERGRNLVSSSRTDSWYSRYSEYVFLAQTRGTDQASGKAAAQIKATAKDPAITRRRCLVQRVSASDEEELQSRVDLERSRRAGSGETFTAIVDGWGTDEGRVWRPNTVVSFVNPVLGVDAQLIVSRATFRFGATVSRETELVMVRPETYLPEQPYPVTQRGAKFG